MNFLKGISLFCVSMLVVLCIGILGQVLFPEKIATEEVETEYETATYIFVPNAVLSDEKITEEVIHYYLGIEGNEIVVYKNNDDNFFMETGLKFEDMPDTLKREIEEHKSFDSIEEVYDFLESYSS